MSDRGLAIAGLLAAVLFGIAGVSASYYFYINSVQASIPTFMVDPARAQIISYDPKKISGLSVLYDGKPITESR